MSASREKKQRQQAPDAAERKRQQLLEERKAKRRKTAYTILGIVVALLVAALLVWNSGFFQRRASAVKIGDETFTVSDLSYYYYTLLNQEIQTARLYSQYGLSYPYNPNLSPSRQMYDTEKTYAEYFRELAVQNLQRVTFLCREAEKEGYTLSEEGEKQIADAMSEMATYAAAYGYSKQAFLKANYGPYMTEAAFQRQLTRSQLASEYYDKYSDSLTYTDQQLQEYYENNANLLDTYDYRYCFISGYAASTTDEDGNLVEPTQEEKDAAMKAAKEKAEEMISRYQAGEEFNELAKEYAGESVAENYSDPEYNHHTDRIGSELVSLPYGQWLTDSARKPGDIGIAESSGSGYYVVLFNMRQRLDNSYQTVNVRHILIKAETDAAEDADTDVLPTEAQLEAAYAKAEELLARWKAGEATEESFADLAKEYSEDPGSKDNGGLYENITRDAMIPTFNDWIFTPGRKPGDTGIVANTNGVTNDARGYHIIYFVSGGEIRWKYNAKAALRSDDLTEWLEAGEEAFPVTTLGGIRLVK